MSDLSTPTPSYISHPTHPIVSLQYPYISHPTHPIVSLQYPYTQLHISPHSPLCLTSVPLHPVTYLTPLTSLSHFSTPTPVTYLTPLTPLSHFSTPTPSYISYPTHPIVSLQYPYTQLHISPHSPLCLTSVPLHPVTYFTPLTPLSHFSTPTPSYISYPTHPIVSLQYPYTQLHISPHSPLCLTSVPLHLVTCLTPFTGVPVCPCSYIQAHSGQYFISVPLHPV